MNPHLLKKHRLYDLSKSPYFKESLIRASKDGDLNKVNQLLECKGTHINLKDKYGNTALLLSLFYEHFNIVNRLLDYNIKNTVFYIDVNLQNIYGWTPLMFASSRGHLNAVNRLLDFKDVYINIQKDD